MHRAIKRSLLLLALLLLGFAADASAQEWVQTNGPTATEFYSIIFNKKQDMFVIDGHLIRSTDHGASWKNITPEVSNNSIGTIVIGANNDIYISFSYLLNPEYIYRTYKSTDNGNSWDSLLSKQAFAVASYDSTIYLACQDSAYSYFLESTNAGKTWDSVFFLRNMKLAHQSISILME